ncbi:hypothetical protein ACH4FX_37230 [Streptomyces sp. NPDC018019]|uniref:hypothetical protein n=1 Tax=Streptomyces sp. NPDC018019 TaxID=3365030 RepID=UPI00379CEAC8
MTKPQQQMRETWARAIEPEPSVTITEETFFGHGWQPLTIAVLQALWFMPPGENFDVAELTGWFRAMGWKSANGKPLGEDAVRRELALIRKAGYIRAYRLKGEDGRMVGMRYEISKRPKPPQERIEVVAAGLVNPQVTPHASNDGTWNADETETRRSRHVPPMATYGESPHVADGAKPQVAPCASNGGFPPTPPREVVDTTSPNPLTDTADHSRFAAREKKEEGAEAEFDAKAIAAAEEFLQELPAPWAVGRPTAKRYAPLLVESTRAQGWDLDDALVAELIKGERPNNPQGALKARIENLVRRHRAAATATVPGQIRPVEQPAAVLPPHCGHLDCDELTRMKTTEDEHGWRSIAPCAECHPGKVRQPAAARA